MLSCKQNLSFEIKVGVHIYLGTFQRIADVAHRIVSGCTPSLYHRSKIPFSLCLAYAFIGSTVISKSTLGLSDCECPGPVLFLCIFLRSVQCLPADALNLHSRMFFSHRSHDIVIIPGVCSCVTLCQTDAWTNEPCQFIYCMALSHFLFQECRYCVLLFFCASGDKLSSSFTDPVENARCLSVKLKSETVQDWLPGWSRCYCLRPH